MKALKLPKISLSGAPKVRLPRQAQLLKTFFLTRAFREKVLLLGFIVLVTAVWFSGVVKRTGNFRRDFKMTTDDLEAQADWLTQQSRIEGKAKAAVEHLDPSKTFDHVRLQGEIDPLLKQAGIAKYSIDPPVSERTSVFTKHSISVTIREADYASLVRFYLEVVKRTPYIGFEQVLISTNNNSKQHSANMRITSVELVGK